MQNFFTFNSNGLIEFSILGQVLKKWVSGFDFKKPGYPGWISGSQNIENKASKMSQIKKLVFFY